MEPREQLLAKLEQLKRQTIEFAEQVRSTTYGHAAFEHLRHKWAEIAKEVVIKSERVKVQSEFRVGVVQGKYPVPIVEIIYGTLGNRMRLLVLDLMVLAEQVGVCPLEVSYESVDQLLTAVYEEEFPHIHKVGHIVACWRQKEGPFSKDAAERAKYRNWELPKLPTRKTPEKKQASASLPPSSESAAPDLAQLDDIGRGLVSHGKSIEAAAEMLVGVGLLAFLFQQPKRR